MCIQLCFSTHHSKFIAKTNSHRCCNRRKTTKADLIVVGVGVVGVGVGVGV